MSDSRAPFHKKCTPRTEDDLLGPARASMRTRLGKFMDVYMDAKIKIAQKIADKIAGENDVDKLMELRAKLNDVMFAKDDVTQLDTKIKALLTMSQTNAKAFIALWNEWRTATEDSHGHSHCHHDNQQNHSERKPPEAKKDGHNSRHSY